jgi:hypothetical protein
VALAATITVDPHRGLTSISPLIYGQFLACFPHFNNRKVRVNKFVEGRPPTLGRVVALLTADFTSSKPVVPFWYASFGSFSLQLAERNITDICW